MQKQKQNKKKNINFLSKHTFMNSAKGTMVKNVFHDMFLRAENQNDDILQPKSFLNFSYLPFERPGQINTQEEK